MFTALSAQVQGCRAHRQQKIRYVPPSISRLISTTNPKSENIEQPRQICSKRVHADWWKCMVHLDCVVKINSEIYNAWGHCHHFLLSCSVKRWEIKWKKNCKMKKNLEIECNIVPNVDWVDFCTINKCHYSTALYLYLYSHYIYRIFNRY